MNEKNEPVDPELHVDEAINDAENLLSVLIALREERSKRETWEAMQEIIKQESPASMYPLGCYKLHNLDKID